MKFLLTGFNMADLALFLNRTALGVFFMISGYYKLFTAQARANLICTLKKLHIPMVKFNSWWVPGVEFAAGAALAVGLLSPLAATGLLSICCVACCTAGPDMVKSYNPDGAMD